jgi:predicted nucleotidyltransferase
MNPSTRRTDQSPSAEIAPVVPTGCEQRVSDTLPIAVRRIAEELDPDKIILFGSFAYGTATPDSDVDLLVIMETNATSPERSWSVSRLLIPRPFPVDILVKTPAEIERALAKGDFFVREVLARGKVLYERHH